MIPYETFTKLIQALRSAPHPESMFDQANWNEEYYKWWHKYASEEAIQKLTENNE